MMITRFDSLKTLVVAAAVAHCLGGALLAQTRQRLECDKLAPR